MSSLVFCSKCGKTEQPGEEFTNKDGSTICKDCWFEEDNNNSVSNNKKILYQLSTDGKGSFAVNKDKYSHCEYNTDSTSQEPYSKLIDSKMLYDGSITEELVQDWIEELKKADILDKDGNLIYVKLG